MKDQVLNTTRSEWGDAEYQRVWEEGQAMPLAEAVDFSLKPLDIQSVQEEVSHQEDDPKIGMFRAAPRS